MMSELGELSLAQSRKPDLSRRKSKEEAMNEWLKRKGGTVIMQVIQS